jgi:tRNA modification GTPase
VLFFPGPHSFTGEDVVELQAHGGPVILDLLLQDACQRGARQAEPGEFSQRAYLNDKIDLAQAEAIADLINSTTEQAALNASRSLQGDFSRKIDELVALVTQLRIYVEAAIDFPEEEIDFIAEGQVAIQLQAIIDQLDAVLTQARQGSLLREGMKLVIAGKPNAGKSSLLNALAGIDSAIVTAIPGTTRDVLREHIQIDGMPVHVVDTAGLRDSEDEVEQEGIRRARLEIASADRILLVVDSCDAQAIDKDALLPEQNKNQARNIPLTLVYNKCDLSGLEPGIDDSSEDLAVTLSAATGAGLDLLKQHLKSSMGYQEQGEGNFSARRRHLQALAAAGEFLQAGQAQLTGAGAAELLAEDLRQCQQSLGEITGAVSSDELLGRIFSSFCIGK